MQAKQHAQNLLAMVNQVTGPYDDRSLAAVLGAKKFLQDIVSGKLVVGAPIADTAAEEPK
jgi:hypothetical protein